MKDVLIVPEAPVAHYQTNGGHRSVYQQNWCFAQQWKAKSPIARDIVTMPLETASSPQGMDVFETALGSAARLAQDRRVILSIGHGAAAGYRGAEETAFDATPERGAHMADHQNLINAEVLSVPEWCHKENGQWVVNQNCHWTPQQVTNNSRRYDSLVRAGQSLSAQRVRALWLLSCNIARDMDFLRHLAHAMGITIRAYEGLIAMAETTVDVPQASGATRREYREMIWVSTTDGTDVPSREDDPNAALYTEIPTSPMRSAAP
jgi:hypothetical protein